VINSNNCFFTGGDVTENKQNGNGSGEYRPAVEYEYLAADVWFEEIDGEKDVTYTEDILKELDSESDDEASEDNTQN
jgi:hypothetical protein